MEWSIAEPAWNGNHARNDPPEGWRTIWLLAFPAGSGIIGTMIRSKGGVDVEAGRHNNNPEFRSSISKMVAEPAGKCIIQSMMNTKPYTVEHHDKTMEFHVIRWSPLSNGVHTGESVERFQCEDEAMEVARILNQAEELSLYLDQACEFDS